MIIYIMKRVLLILTMVIGCSLLASCEKETMLTVNQSSLSFNNSGGSQTVNLIANKVWSASSNQGWCKVSPSSGDGSDNSNFTLSVSCDANTTYDERSCTITVVCEELTSTITVTQAEGKGLIVSQTEYNITNEAQTISVEVQANVQYTVSIDDACKSWIKQESTKGLSSNTVKFAISKNESYDGREGKITIKQTDGSLLGTVMVKQSQQNGLFVTTSEYNLSNEKHTLTVEVKANVEFDVKSNADWIKYVETKGLKTSQIVLDVAANEFYDEREGTVIVKQKNGNLEGVITIRQEQNYGIFVSQSEFSLTNEAQTIDVEVKYNVDFEVVIPDGCKDWIKQVTTKGLNTKNYTFSIAKNEAYDNREGSITFKQKNGSLSGTISVRQNQTDGIIVEKKEYIVSDEEQELTIKVLSNIGYSVVIDESCARWISLLQTKGLTDGYVSFHIMKNEGEERKGNITFKSERIQETVVVRQQAEGFVDFEDANFKAYCVQHFDKNGDGEISFSEARKIYTIDVSTSNIQSLRGIEYMANLKYLMCRGGGVNQGKLKTLDVNNNAALEWLICNGNQLTSLEVSSSSLTFLDCTDNILTSLDISNAPLLKDLSCSKNLLTNLDVSRNMELATLICSNNLLASLDLSNNADLTALTCTNNQIKNLDLSNNTALQSIGCGSNLLTKLDVSNNRMLTGISCEDNLLTTLDVSNIFLLEWLTCSKNMLTTIDVSNNAALTHLICNNNQLTSLDVSNNIALVDLVCYNNQLTSLDVRNNTSLIHLLFTNNYITSIDVSNNTAVEQLWCAENQLTNIDVRNLTALREFICRGNQLTNIDVSNNKDLKDFRCGNNQLTSIDVSNNVALTSFSCDNNKLENIDISNNTVLDNLVCDDNQLKSLDLSKNIGLLQLFCSNNLLTSLDLSNNINLKTVWCFSNPYLKEIWLKTNQIIPTFEYDKNVTTIKYKD